MAPVETFRPLQQQRSRVRKSGGRARPAAQSFGHGEAGHPVAAVQRRRLFTRGRRGPDAEGG